MSIVRKYGWKPDIPDFRDFKLKVERELDLPDKIDLRSTMPAVYDQSQLGSCTANAIAASLDFDRKQQGKEFITPSRLFIYYNERAIEGSIDTDSGALIRDGIKSVADLGVCPEQMWEYNIAKFQDKPSFECYEKAMDYQALKYERIDSSNLYDLRCVLAKGHPFVFGFSVYSSFESKEVASTGIVPMPGRKEKLLGGHAVLCVGYSDLDSRFLVRNSWGDKWGQAGYFTIPYDYLTNTDLADDFWNITEVE